MRTLSKIALGLLLCAPLAAHAHKAWLLPSATVLSGEDPWITVDAAVSNDLFYFNHVPLNLDGLVVTAPNGKTITPEHVATGQFRNTFDLHLTEPGTYRIAIAGGGLFASWKEDGKTKRWRGDAAKFASEVPKDAAELTVTQSTRRIETFVTVGAPDTAALKPTGVGLELAAVTHPNDLFAGEKATFQLLLDGKPIAKQAVTLIADGSRYRNAQDEIDVVTDADGRFSVTWPAAGRYWMESAIEDDKATMAPATQRRLGYVATFEVLPQ